MRNRHQQKQIDTLECGSIVPLQGRVKLLNQPKLESKHGALACHGNGLDKRYLPG